MITTLLICNNILQQYAPNNIHKKEIPKSTKHLLRFIYLASVYLCKNAISRLSYSSTLP